MTRKVLVLCLAAIFVVGVAVPVLAQSPTLTPQAAKLSERALAKAKVALRTARAAKRQARLAEEAGNAAAQSAAVASGEAKGAAAEAQAAVDSTRVQSAVAAGDATTLAEGFVALPGGPNLTVMVPASGLIEVWAQVTMDEAGAVSLYQDDQEMPGQSGLCGPPEGGAALFSGTNFPFESGPLTLSTPAGGPFNCANEGAPGSLLFQTSPGQHIYELRYASCGCGVGGTGSSPVTFSQRRLYVAPRL